MKFLIQKINGEIRHDFAFSLLEAIRFNNWLINRDNIDFELFDTEYDETTQTYKEFKFKQFHSSYVPVGSVEFVTAFTQYFFGVTPKPRNIPNELLKPKFLQRFVFNGTEKEICGQKFVKSNDGIKLYAEFVDDKTVVPEGNYQISDVINIESEWRAFVYRGRLRGLQNYSGEFTMFPDVEQIERMINEYTPNAPIAYTLDVGVNREAIEFNSLEDYSEWNTFIIEVHDFFSCGLYGFADFAILPQMFHFSFQELIKRNCNIK